MSLIRPKTLQWRHNERDCVSNHRRLHCFFNCCFRWSSKKTSKPRVTGLCAGNPPVTTQKTSNAEMFPLDDTTMNFIDLIATVTMKSQRNYDKHDKARIIGHDDVIKWKHFPRYWPFVRGIHRSPVKYPHKGQWRGAMMFCLIRAWINSWVNNCEAGGLRRYLAHCDVIVMVILGMCCSSCWINTEIV